MAEIYAKVDVMVLASRGGDSMPGVLIEAGLSGIPCVATPIEAIGEVVIDDETGVLVPIDDPQALADGVRHAVEHGPRLGNAARAHCLATFDIRVIASAWKVVLDQVISSRS